MTNEKFSPNKGLNLMKILGLVLLGILSIASIYLWTNSKKKLDQQFRTVSVLSSRIDSIEVELNKQKEQQTSANKPHTSSSSSEVHLEEQDKTKEEKPPKKTVKGYLGDSFVFKGKRYYAFKVDVRETKLEVFHQKKKGLSIEDAKDITKGKKKNLIFATNGGIFEKDYSSTGLLVKDGSTIYPLNTKNGEGNFYLKPNGVVYQEGEKVAVITTKAYKKRSPNPVWATQSGPMLVVDGRIQNQLKPNSPNFRLRSGVGVIGRHTLVFVISKSEVRFHELASVFLRKFKSKNALYLDGVISDMYIKGLKSNMSNHNFSSIITVSHE